MKRKRIALIDGDEILYKVGFACVDIYYELFKGSTKIVPINFQDRSVAEQYLDGEDITILPVTNTAPLTDHIKKLHREIDGLVYQTESKDYQIYLNDSSNFRHDIATILPYKGNRSISTRPIYHEMLRDYMLSELGAVIWENAEADDGLSYNQKEKSTIICSQDKDLDMVPGLRRFRDGSISYISEEDGIKSFYRQLLMGDPTDNIPGIYGIGKVKADRILEKANTEKQCFDITRKVYENYMKKPNPKDTVLGGLNKTSDEVLLEIGQLLWMQRPHRLIWSFPTE